MGNNKICKPKYTEDILEGRLKHKAIKNKLSLSPEKLKFVKQIGKEHYDINNLHK